MVEEAGDDVMIMLVEKELLDEMVRDDGSIVLAEVTLLGEVGDDRTEELVGVMEAVGGARDDPGEETRLMVVVGDADRDWDKPDAADIKLDDDVKLDDDMELSIEELDAERVVETVTWTVTGGDPTSITE